MVLLSGIHGSEGGGLQKKVPKGRRKAPQWGQTVIARVLGPGRQPGWGNPPHTLAYMPLARARRG